MHELSEVSGKWKLGQNRPEADRRGMIDGLRGEDDDAATALATLVRNGG